MTALHFAAFHGQIEMINALLSHKADVFACRPVFSIQRAVLLNHVEAAEALMTSMESADKTPKLNLTGDLAAAALEDSSLPADLVCRIVKWEAEHVQDKTSLLHCWAKLDRDMAFSAVSRLGLNEAIGALDKKDESGATPLDYAIKCNSS